VKIEVTQEDINYGVRASRFFCPIAIATKRVSGRSVVVHGGCIWEYGKIVAWLPDEAYHWYLKYDSGAIMEPIAFETTEEMPTSLR